MSRKFFITAFFSLFPLSLSASGVAINEVFFDPTGTDTGLEWIEIFNSGDAPADMSGWQLYPDGIGYFSFPQGLMIAPKSFILVHLRATGVDSEKELYHAGAGGNMGNTSGSVALFSGEPRGKETLKSFMQWGRGGETWEGAAEDAGVWKKGAFVELAGFSEGSSLSLTRGLGGVAASDWIISPPTPLSENGSASTNQPVSSPAPGTVVSPPPPASVFSPSAVLPAPQISAYAGVDKIVAVGSLAEFIGIARGLNGEPLENARFWWNFGDGGTAEGHLVSHIFEIPGQYMVGLHISSGSYAASDYLAVNVISNQIEVVGVLLKESGFLRLRNASKYDLDIGGWIIEDSQGKRFALPAKTIIGGNAEIAFSNSLTGIFNHATNTAVRIYYSNGIVALNWKKVATSTLLSLPAAKSESSTEVGLAPARALRVSAPMEDMPSQESAKTPVLQEKSEMAASVSSARPVIFLVLAFLGSFVAAVVFFLIRKFYIL